MNFAKVRTNFLNSDPFSYVTAQDRQSGSGLKIRDFMWSAEQPPTQICEKKTRAGRASSSRPGRNLYSLADGLAARLIHSLSSSM